MRFARLAAFVAVTLALDMLDCPPAFSAGTLTAQGGARKPISIRDHRVAVTIDDGFASTASLALPVLPNRAIAAFGRERLAYFKVPGWIVFVDELPTTSTSLTTIGGDEVVM